MKAPEPSGRFTMSHRELPHKKVHAPRGKKLCSTDHPFDTGFERLLDGESLTKIIPDWILDKREPTPTEWESATWLAGVINQHNRTGTRQTAQPPAWALAIHQFPLGETTVVTNNNYPEGRNLEVPPSRRRLGNLFASIKVQHRLNGELDAWDHHTHTRVRTEYGSYTVQEMAEATPKQLSRLPSKQVRDYLNEKGGPGFNYELKDLRPDNPRLRGTWQTQSEAIEPTSELPTFETIVTEAPAIAEIEPQAAGSDSHETSQTGNLPGPLRRNTEDLNTRVRPPVPRQSARSAEWIRYLPGPEWSPNQPFCLANDWYNRRRELQRGWIYRGTYPRSSNGSWSHESSGSWFLNIHGDCSPWVQELDPKTGYTYFWLRGTAPVHKTASFWSADQESHS